MTKWDKLFGLEHPEVYGKIKDPEKPEDKERTIYFTDLPQLDHEILVALCVHLKLDITHLYNKYAKTLKEQYEAQGRKYKP